MNAADTRAPAGAQERYPTVFDVVFETLREFEGAKWTEGPRSFAGELARKAAARIEALAPQPQGDRAALVERAKDVLNVLMGYLRAHRWGEERPDYESAERAYWRLQGELSSLSSPAEATGDGIADDTEAIQRGAPIRPGKLAEATERPAQGEGRAE